MPAKSKLKIKTRKHLTRGRTDHFADGWRYLVTDSNACMIFLVVGGTGFFPFPVSVFRFQPKGDILLMWPWTWPNDLTYEFDLTRVKMTIAPNTKGHFVWMLSSEHTDTHSAYLLQYLDHTVVGKTAYNRNKAATDHRPPPITSWTTLSTRAH